MKINRYNISKPRKVVGKDGKEKTYWDNVGIMTEFVRDDGSVGRKLEIPAIGLEAQIFPVKANEQQSQPKPQPQAVESNPTWPSPIDDTGSDIDPEEIPF